MSFTGILDEICTKYLDDLARQIEAELKAEVRGHSRSGKALSAIHIEDTGKYSRFIGGTDGTGKGVTGTDHLAMLNNGNGTRTIYPKGRGNGGANALRYSDGTFHGKSEPYAGIDFVGKVARRHK